MRPLAALCVLLSACAASPAEDAHDSREQGVGVPTCGASTDWRERCRDELSKRLEAIRVLGFDVNEADLGGAFDAYEAATGIPVVVAPSAKDAARDEGILFTINLPVRLSGLELLNILTNCVGDSVTYSVGPDEVLITTQEVVTERPVVRVYDVRSLVPHSAYFPRRKNEESLVLDVDRLRRERVFVDRITLHRLLDSLD